jgi:hypothetical protein
VTWQWLTQRFNWRQQPCNTRGRKKTELLLDRLGTLKTRDAEDLVDTTAGWPNAGRVVWLTGGLVAFNNPGPDVEVCAGSNGKTIHKFTISAYGVLFEALKKQGFSIIGGTFVVSTEELDGLRPAEFRTAGARGGWPLWTVKQQWREIAFGAGKRNAMQLLDISSRIAFGLEYSQMRLYDLAASYGFQLRAHLQRDQTVGYHVFKDLNSREVYKSIHALFWELAVLRDTLAEFVAVFCLAQSGIRTHGGLLKSIKRAPSTDPVAREILSDSSLNGWLSRFSCYRDFFTHVAPMEWAAGVAFTVRDIRRINDNLLVPQIYYPLPGNIDELTRDRSKGIFYPTLEALGNASRSRRDRAVDPDALEYLHSSLDRFVELATLLLSRSPIVPTPVSVTADISGDIKWTPGAP